MEMTLDGEEKKQESTSVAVSGGVALPLVGGRLWLKNTIGSIGHLDFFLKIFSYLKIFFY